MLLSIDLISHVIATVLTAVFTWRFYYPNDMRKLFLAGIVSSITGIWVDLDHFIDYFLYYGPSFHLTQFLQGSEFASSNKLYIFFHAYEYVLILVILFVLFKDKLQKFLVATLAISLILHIGIDIATFGVPLQAYSLIYRFATNFALPTQ